ncbi:unnamed protein product [Dovyalis caffra]|uniref:2'-phosphotransferase n=1 Tax=Dovyalis caffra TaxID=77055 RepID=A0AAV1QUN4_9ROSI|nr:unnamed protein product [Dovyalis caffra]
MQDDRERSRGHGCGGCNGGGGGSSKDKIDALGRLLTQTLRHMASELNLNMRSDGFVKVEDLLKLNMKTYVNVPLRSHTMDDVKESVRKDNKQRFSLLEEGGELLIRANQGHTIKTVESGSLLEPILSPEEITVSVHGTYKKNLDSILESGLKRMKRLHVHFSCGLPTDGEVISGMRRDVNCLIFLDVRKALEVLELHQNPVVEGPPMKKNTKSDNLILGSAAGQGLPNHLQCQGTKGLNKTHLPSSSSAGESIAFVTVFTVYNTSLATDSRLSNLVTVGNASYAKTESSMAVLNVFINSIQF